MADLSDSNATIENVKRKFGIQSAAKSNQSSNEDYNFKQVTSNKSHAEPSHQGTSIVDYIVLQGARKVDGLSKKEIAPHYHNFRESRNRNISLRESNSLPLDLNSSDEKRNHLAHRKLKSQNEPSGGIEDQGSSQSLTEQSRGHKASQQASIY